MQHQRGQMTLPFRTPAAYATTDFIAAPSNAAARFWLANPQDWPDRRMILWAGDGCGKTHLAHIWAAPDGVLLQGADLAPPARPPDAPRLVIDNADACADEPALLHLLNQAAELGRAVLLTGRSPPASWKLRLADLTSRLRAMQAVQIAPPEDDLLQTLLARLLAERQLAVPPAVQDWLRLHLPRNARALSQAADRLDAASLARQHPVTRALARACLDGLLQDAPDGEDELCKTANDGSRQPGETI